jgi:UDP-GlcNAc:undecaprenyl-phosphate GlcNAc-1-phosphate transferase
MNPEYWIYVLIASISYTIGYILYRTLLSKKWIYSLFSNHIRDRDIHTDHKPKIGGLVIIPSFIVIFLGLIVLGILEWQQEFWGLLGGSLAILVYGYIDELYDLPSAIQFIWQIGIVTIVIASGVGIEAINLPNGNIWFVDTITWGYMTFPRDIITAFWIIGLMNVVNWLDGLDGLASGVGLIGFSILFMLVLTPFVNQAHIAVLLSVLCGLYGSFLWYNAYPSKIFLGTYGSMFLGYMLSLLAIISGGKIATSALVLAFPIIDAGIVIIQRIMAKQSIFQGDNRHFHHKLIAIGFSQPKAVWIMYGMSIVFGYSALQFNTYGKLVTFLIGGCVLMISSGILSYRIAQKSKK